MRLQISLLQQVRVGVTQQVVLQQGDRHNKRHDTATVVVDQLLQLCLLRRVHRL